MRTGRRAFTLVELLVVIGILGLLIGILMPSLSRARNAANRTVCANNLRQIGTAFQLFWLDHDGAYPAANDPLSTSPLIWLWMGRGWRPALEPYASRGGIDPGVFWCKSDSQSEVRFDNTSYAYSMSFYHSPDQINLMTDLSDNFSNAKPAIRQKAAAVLYPTQKILAGEWFANHAPSGVDSGWFAPGGARVFLFADGHVQSLDWKQLHPANDGLPNPNLTRDGIRGRDVQ